VLAGAESSVSNELTAFLEELKHNCDLLRFADVAPDGILAGALRDGTKPDDTFAVIVPSPAQAGVDLTGTFEAYFAGRGAKVRRNFRHSCRAFEADHDARFLWFTPESTEHALACFDQLWSLHSTSFSRREEFDYFQNAQIRDFHRAVLASPGILALVRFARIASPTRVFGSLYSLVHRRRVYCYQKGFDAGVEKLSPGFVLVGGAIQAAFDEGCTYFDFLRGDEAYKQRWANAKHYAIGYMQTMDTVPAALWHAVAGLHSGLRKLKRALRGSVPNEPARHSAHETREAIPAVALAN
jgi:CelD/BcsL family acetyltransferase involved in cellulose biosynthesis